MQNSGGIERGAAKAALPALSTALPDSLCSRGHARGLLKEIRSPGKPDHSAFLLPLRAVREQAQTGDF